MEIKITIEAEGVEPVKIKIDIPENKGNSHSVGERTDVSCYAVWFDENCLGWSKHAELNKMFLLQQQNYMNEKLKAVGHVFLNEVYDCLGIPRTAVGQCVGWVYNVENPVGDNFVDFDLYAERNANFINGYDRGLLLDFNVDGDILKYL